MILLSLYKPLSVLLISALFTLSAYTYHRSIVKSEVNAAVLLAKEQVHKEYEDKHKDLASKADVKTKDIEDKTSKSKKEKDAEIKVLSNQRNAARKWVYELPSTSLRSKPIESYSTRSPSDAETSSREIIGELSRTNADDLIEYATDAEEVKINLLQCYKDYDSVKQVLDDYRVGE